MSAAEAAGVAPGVRSPATARFLAEVDAASERALLSTGGGIELRVRLADKPLRLLFAGCAVADLIAPTFSHLRVESGGEPSLTVRIWDSESSATEMPSPPWEPAAHRLYGMVPELCGHDLFASVQWPTNALSLLDLRRRIGFYWVRSASRLADHEGTPPMVTILHAWLARQGVQVVHAGAVGRPTGCALLVGKNGSGKSNATLACVTSELGLLGDDYCALAPGRRPTVFSMYNVAKAHPDTLERMPFLVPLVSEPRRRRDGKALLLLHDRLPGRVLASAPLQAVLIPRIAGLSGTTVKPTGAAAALAGLAPSTIAQLPGDAQGALSRLAALVTDVPCYYLDAGTDPVGVVGAIASVLEP